MPFASTDAQSAALDALWGDGHAAGFPDDFEVGLLTAAPHEGGVELVEPGYERVEFTSAALWPDDAVDGVKLSATVQLWDATDAWSEAGTHWGIFVDGDLFDWGRLSDDGVVVGAAGPVPAFTLAVFFSELTP